MTNSNTVVPKVFVALLMTVFVIIGSGTSASASTDASAKAGSNETLGQPLSSSQAKRIAKDIDLASKAKSGKAVNEEEAAAWEQPDGSVFVNHPIPDNAGNFSSIGALVDPNSLEILTTTEIVLEEESESSGTIVAWIDGEKRVDKEFSDADSNQITAMASGGFWDKLNDCLSSAGIASWVVASLSTVCAVACVGTAGAGCVACIAAAAGISGGTVGYCVDQAQK